MESVRSSVSFLLQNRNIPKFSGVSSTAMEDSFKVRVDKIFGSLSSSGISPEAPDSSLSSLWCLTDDEIERREWIQGKGGPEPELETNSFFAGKRKVNEKNSLRFENELEDELDDIDDDADENRRSSSSCMSAKPDEYGDEEWEIKSSIGLDSTLDYEEEEDEYDKVAVGKEKAGDRLYMSDITDSGIEINSCNELPTSLRSFARDPRANHLAAKIRLKEDAEASRQIDSLRVSENCVSANVESECNPSENPKSILKRKDNHLDAKSQKRVRFDPECKISYGEETQESKDVVMETSSSPEAVEVANVATFSSRSYPTQVPDYLRNPSRYTHYTFDSSNDVDEESNKKAYMDFLKLVKGSNTAESQPDDTSMSPPKSITFIPKKKAGNIIMLENSAPGEPVHKRVMPTGIAAVNSENNEICSMEEDEPEDLDSARNSSQKLGRRYRMRAKMLEEEA